MKKLKKLNNKPVYLFVGLGNPGAEYHKTRHNVGFCAIDLLVKQHDLSLKKPLFQPLEWGVYQCSSFSTVIVKPLTYMNRSGTVLPSLMKKWDISAENVFIITDNMDLAPGEIRIKRKGSPGGHNGIASVVDSLGTSAFNRIYIGVGRPADASRVVEHVLGCPGGEELHKIEEGITRASEALLALEKLSLERVINAYNRKNPG